MATIHTVNIDEVHDVPIEVIKKPIIPVLEEKKVLSLMETIKNPKTQSEVPPIDLLWVENKTGGNFYFSFGGCHRFEAYKRLDFQSIPCKLVKSTPEDIASYLGNSTPSFL